MRQMLTTIRQYSWGQRLRIALEACLLGVSAVLLIAALASFLKVLL